jgi:hypothetical protein
VTVYAPVPSAQGQATDGAGGCTSHCTAKCSARFVSVPQGKWLCSTLKEISKEIKVRKNKK